MFPGCSKWHKQLAAKHQLICRVSWLCWVFCQNTKHSVFPLQFWLDIIFFPLQSRLFKFFIIKQTSCRERSGGQQAGTAPVLSENPSVLCQRGLKRPALSWEWAANQPSATPADKSQQARGRRLEGKCLNQISGHIENYNSKSLHSLRHRNKPETKTRKTCVLRLVCRSGAHPVLPLLILSLTLAHVHETELHGRHVFSA